jgi:hypothetical protein
MAYLTKKNDHNYIRDYRKEPKLDENGLPVKDEAGNIVYKYVNLWIRSLKIKKLAEIELAKYEENKDKERIELEKKHTAWKEFEARYLAYSKANKVDTSIRLDTQVFKTSQNFTRKFRKWQT